MPQPQAENTLTGRFERPVSTSIMRNRAQEHLQELGGELKKG